ncbi:alpha-L-arabinofuranosidase C-terminal domain-containing protein [Viscerimonas tarda]
MTYFGQVKLKFLAVAVLTVLCSFPVYSANHKVENEPDSVYLFSYASETDGGRNGLHFAWSIDQEDWHPIGPGHSFLKCDYGRWGSEKRMIQPKLFQSSDGLWHCVWTLNETVDAFAQAASTDLIQWGRQSYPALKDIKMYLPANEILVKTSTISGKPESGNTHKVPWPVVDNLIKAQQLSAYKNLLYSENTSGDAGRFASLKPVEATISVDVANGKNISNMLTGIFFEDINYAADGGLYAELVQNRDFEYALGDKQGRDKTWNSTSQWKIKNGELRIDTVNPVHPNNKHYVVLKNGETLINNGFDGIPVKAGEKYDFSVFAKGKKGKLLVQLIDNQDNELGKTELSINADNWKKYETVLIANKTVSDARLQLSILNSQFSIDMVSLFPQHTFRNRKNGLRSDLAQVVADIQPRFVRFPGGCVAHGDGLENMYRWKNTIGPLESRKPQRNIWNYHQTAGLGYFEYFLFCEDIGAEPVPILPAGVPCQNSGTGSKGLGGQQGGITMDEMDDYVQEVLDLIEYANGDLKTTWGKKRAEAGHPKPFNLKYIGIGNEDQITDIFEERFTLIFNAVKEKHPEITVIGTAGPFYEGTDYVEGWKIATQLGVPMIDEHYYNPPGWFIHNQDFYDKYDRTKPKVYLGEYAAHLPGRPNNMETALAEALYLTAVERNGDVVSMTSYAPLLAKEGHTQWNPDLIYFNNTEVKPTVGYYVQQLYGQNAGDMYLPTKVALSENRDAVKKRIASSVVRDSRTNDLIVKLVNMLPVEVNTRVKLDKWENIDPVASKTVLTGSPADKQAKPTSGTCEVSADFPCTLPAYSFTVIRIKMKD